MVKVKLDLPERQKWYTVEVLLDAMKSSGASWSSKDGLLQNERRGTLSLPRMGNSRRDRAVTRDMIVEIIDAFSPGGSGEWHHSKEKSATV